MKKLVLGFICLVLSSAASAQSLSIAFNDSSVQLGYGFLVGGSSYGRNELRLDFLYNDDDVYVADASFRVFDEVGSNFKGLTAGLGGKVYGASLVGDEREALALGVGGMLRYALPNMAKRLIFGIDGTYAPPIISFLDADRFYELAFRVEYEMIQTASVFVEHHQMTMDDDGETRHLNKGFRIGLDLTF